MGWYFTPGASRANIIADLTREQTWTDGKGRTRRNTVLRHCARGNVLWALVESDLGDGAPAVRLVACYLLKNGGRRDGWGYKPMDETVGPFYYTCPLSYLDGATAPLNETAAKWRATVRAKAGAA